MASSGMDRDRGRQRQRQRQRRKQARNGTERERERMGDHVVVVLLLLLLVGATTTRPTASPRRSRPSSPSRPPPSVYTRRLLVGRTPPGRCSAPRSPHPVVTPPTTRSLTPHLPVSRVAFFRPRAYRYKSTTTMQRQHGLTQPKHAPRARNSLNSLNSLTRNVHHRNQRSFATSTEPVTAPSLSVPSSSGSSAQQDFSDATKSLQMDMVGV